MTNRSPTIDDVAASAGVSRATVSRALNGGSVSAATLQRVRAAADRLGYRPNQAATSLARGSSGVIGIVLHSPLSSLHHDAYTAALYGGITDALAEQGTVGVMQWFGRGDRAELAEVVVSSQFVDGIIATVVDADDLLVPRLVAAGTPAVVVGGLRFGGQVCSVDIDDEQGGAMATEHLLRCGANRIGHITGSPETISAQDRLAGHERALRAAGVTERIVVEGAFDHHSTEPAERLLDQGVDAVFAASDKIAAAVYQAAARRGLRIPADLQVVGFDDSPGSTTMDPPLTTMHQDPYALGTAAAHLMQEVLSGRERPRRSLMVDTILIERGSTRPLSPRTRRLGRD